MTEAQRRVHDAIVGGRRGSIRGPFPAWLHSPELADRAQNLGEYVRFETSLGARLSELAILVTARFWTSNFEWYAHAMLAREAGLEDPIIDAIEAGVRPRFEHDDDELIYDLATTLHRRHHIGDDLFARGVDRFGHRGMVDLVGVCGYYTLVSMTLNVYRMPVPEGAEEPFPQPAD